MTKKLQQRKTFAIIGDPVDHSRSPELYAPMFASIGMEAEFMRLRVCSDELHNIRETVSRLGLSGFAVTMPHKKAIMEYLDIITPAAVSAGSVNIVSVQKCDEHDGFRLIGYNTDGDGLVAALEEAGVSVKDKEAIILGSGGAAAGAKESLIRHGCSVVTLYRHNGITLNETIASSLHKIKHCDILINATPLGMKGYPEFESLDFLNELEPNAAVADMVYAAEGGETKLIQEARRLGYVCFGGDRMLLHQGLIAFELWTGFKPKLS